MKLNVITLAVVLTGCATNTTTPGSGDNELATVAIVSSPFEEILSEDADSVADNDAEPTTASTEEIWSPIPDLVLPAEGNKPAVDNRLSVVEFDLRRGESLAHFARWSGLTVESVADSSNLSLAGSYPVGTKITIPLTPDELARVEIGRDEHHIKRVEGYLASRGGSSGSEFYKVQTGDNAWVIARSRFGIPVWLPESYNPSVDLEALRPGQELMVPVVDDVVVAAD